ncbi:MAG: ATP-dependent 6-phosphofructokinase [Candidatus Thorarchaeota archaeon]
MKVGVLSSGGDSPGMNACIRAVTRIGLHKKCEVIGIHGGFQGILERRFEKMEFGTVSKILHRGGTCLTTGRSEEFKKIEGTKKAARILAEDGFEGLIAIGGDGTMHGLAALEEYWDGKVIGAPGTIDNDLYGTDYTIGFDTAVNNALEAIDKIRDTAESFSRVFLIEVMGRNSGMIAIHVGIASGASAVLLPETPTDLDAIAKTIQHSRAVGKSTIFVIVAEGDEEGDAATISEKLSSRIGEKCRVSVLGYIQRGGNPTHYDRLLASRLGAFAIDCLLAGTSGVMVGEVNRKLVLTPFEDTWAHKKEIPGWMLDLMHDLSG